MKTAECFPRMTLKEPTLGESMTRPEVWSHDSKTNSSKEQEIMATSIKSLFLSVTAGLAVLAFLPEAGAFPPRPIRPPMAAPPRMQMARPPMTRPTGSPPMTRPIAGPLTRPMGSLPLTRPMGGPPVRTAPNLINGNPRQRIAVQPSATPSGQGGSTQKEHWWRHHAPWWTQGFAYGATSPYWPYGAASSNWPYGATSGYWDTQSASGSGTEVNPTDLIREMSRALESQKPASSVDDQPKREKRSATD
jgi:hypothetical protein